MDQKIKYKVQKHKYQKKTHVNPLQLDTENTSPIYQFKIQKKKKKKVKPNN